MYRVSCFVFCAVFVCVVMSALLLLLLCGRLTFIPPTVRGRCARLGDQRGHGRGAPRAHPREAGDARERGGGVSARHPVLACVALAALSCRCYLSLHVLSLHVFSFLIFSVGVYPLMVIFSHLPVPPFIHLRAFCLCVHLSTCLSTCLGLDAVLSILVVFALLGFLPFFLPSSLDCHCCAAACCVLPVLLTPRPVTRCCGS